MATQTIRCCWSLIKLRSPARRRLRYDGDVVESRKIAPGDLVGEGKMRLLVYVKERWSVGGIAKTETKRRHDQAGEGKDSPTPRSAASQLQDRNCRPRRHGRTVLRKQ